MELVDGETLADAIRRGPMSSERVAEIGARLADALAYVHGEALIHRDVKPANVLLGHDGRVRLTDFGIARLVDAAKVTATGLMVGTASYLAPEQVTAEPVGPAADVYSLGLGAARVPDRRARVPRQRRRGRTGAAVAPAAGPARPAGRLAGRADRDDRPGPGASPDLRAGRRPPRHCLAVGRQRPRWQRRLG